MVDVEESVSSAIANFLLLGEGLQSLFSPTGPHFVKIVQGQERFVFDIALPLRHRGIPRGGTFEEKKKKN